MTDAENVTLVWPRPEGRVDLYRLKWYPVSNSEDIRIKTIQGNIPTEGISRKVSVLIGELHPGVEYMFEIIAETSKFSVVAKSDCIRQLQLSHLSTAVCCSRLYFNTLYSANLCKFVIHLFSFN